MPSVSTALRRAAWLAAGRLATTRPISSHGAMPKLSVETILAALTVAALTAGCRKAAPAQVAPEPAASANAASAPAPAPSSQALGAIDAGIERQKAGAAAPPRARPSANAACGAGTCSDDMKK